MGILFDEYLQRVRSLQDISHNIAVHNNRPVIGRLIRISRKVVLKLLRIPLLPLTNKQSAYNIAVADLLGAYNAHLQQLQQSLSSVQQELEHTRTELHSVQQELEHTRTELRLSAELKKAENEAELWYDCINEQIPATQMDYVEIQASFEKQNVTPAVLDLRDKGSITLPYLRQQFSASVDICMLRDNGERSTYHLQQLALEATRVLTEKGAVIFESASTLVQDKLSRMLCHYGLSSITQAYSYAIVFGNKYENPHL